MAVNVSEKVTAIIKTFERPHCLDMLIKSIKKFYPTLHIIVADDSKSPIPRSDVEYHILPFDSGLSKGRNFLLQQVKTPYFLLLDDDFCFINETSIEKLMDVLENSDIDVVGGRCIETKGVRNSQAVFTIKNELLTLNADPYGKEGDVELYDIVANFFLARTDKLQKHTWDERLKVGEHYDFFLSYKGKLKVAMHPFIYIYHTNDRSNEEYNLYRNRDTEDLHNNIYQEKHGITKVKRKQRRQSIDDIMEYLSKETIETYFGS
ncbi:glycosyltransferase [Bacillus haimaensis]|uniref:glycosyltransferase family 2 protein n=1 Tax=Bacillus haimaensis TaxID=3160967 RepID=UPI003AA88503